MLIIDQIYSGEEHKGDLDGVAMFHDIGETAKLAARLTDETNTVYFGESSGEKAFLCDNDPLGADLMLRVAWKFLRIFEEMGKDYNSSKPPQFRTSVPWGDETWFKALFQEESYRYTSEDFPEEDLLSSLVDIYFRHVNRLFPVLHESSFRSRVSLRLYERDRRFGHLLLSVLSVASLYSTDSRVFEDVDGISVPGHRFFKRVKDWNKTLAVPHLSDLQASFVRKSFHALPFHST